MYYCNLLYYTIFERRYLFENLATFSGSVFLLQFPGVFTPRTPPTRDLTGWIHQVKNRYTVENDRFPTDICWTFIYLFISIYLFIHLYINLFIYLSIY